MYDTHSPKQTICWAIKQYYFQRSSHIGYALTATELKLEINNNI